MFNLPIDAITIQDIEQFLQSGARENTAFELKEQFPNKLEKVISSMANTSGGMILIGVEETATGAGVIPLKGLPLVSGHRERVIEIGLNAIYPPLIPEVRVVEFKTDPSLTAPDKAVVVIRVHESEEGHAVDQRTAIYIRVDNVSDRMRKATVEEIEWFLNKRQKSITEKARIIEQVQQHAQKFLVRLRQKHQRSTSEPLGRFAIWAVPTFPRLPITSPQELYHASIKLIRPTPGIAFSNFPFGDPRPVRDGVSWAYDESRDYCYTEIHQQGLIYSEVEFWWDQQIRERVFLPETAAKLLWATGAFSRSLYRHCGYFGLFDLVMRVFGVADRPIRSTVINFARVMDDMIEAKSTVSASWSEDELFPKCKQMLRDVYWAFGRDARDDRLEADFR